MADALDRLMIADFEIEKDHLNNEWQLVCTAFGQEDSVILSNAFGEFVSSLFRKEIDRVKSEILELENQLRKDSTNE